jgi:hypothetical protein
MRRHVPLLTLVLLMVTFLFHKGRGDLMSELHIEVLPGTPLCSRLAVFLTILWQQPGVLALWIGGSIAHGNADPYSDVDLRVAVKPDTLAQWQILDFAALFHGECLGHQFLSFGEEAFLHHLLLRSGDIYDIWIQSGEVEPPADTILVLGCRDVSLAQRLERTASPATVRPQIADKETIRQLLVDFWIGSHKHRKVLYRNLHLLCMTGIQLDRAVLLRLWYVQQTGRDYGQVRPTIHSLTELVRTVERERGARALQVMGTATTDREQIYQAIEQLRDEVSAVGQRLAAALDFAYPDDLEVAVRHGWSEFLSGMLPVGRH